MNVQSGNDKSFYCSCHDGQVVSLEDYEALKKKFDKYRKALEEIATMHDAEYRTHEIQQLARKTLTKKP